MVPVQVVEKIYNSELARRNELTVSLSTPLAGLAFLSAASGLIITRFDFAFGGIIQSIICIFAVLCSATIVYFLFRTATKIFSSYKSDGYKFIKMSNDISSEMSSRISEFYSDDFVDDAASKNERLNWESNLQNSMVKKYLFCIDNNEKINDLREQTRKSIGESVTYGVIAFCILIALYLMYAVVKALGL